MRVLLDNTVLSNFALVKQSDLLKVALGTAAATTTDVMAEFEAGVERGRLPATNWKWLPVLELVPAEQALSDQIEQHLNKGEASCLALAFHRQARVLTDDRDARLLAGQMRIPVSGTIGVLVRLVTIGRLNLTDANNLLRGMIAQGYRSPVEILDNLV